MGDLLKARIIHQFLMDSAKKMQIGPLDCCTHAVLLRVCCKTASVNDVQIRFGKITTGSEESIFIWTVVGQNSARLYDEHCPCFRSGDLVEEAGDLDIPGDTCSDRISFLTRLKDASDWPILFIAQFRSPVLKGFINNALRFSAEVKTQLSNERTQ